MVVGPAGQSRGEAVERLWNEFSEKWGLSRAPGLQFKDCPEGVGLFVTTASAAEYDENNDFISRDLLRIPKEKAIKVTLDLRTNRPKFENCKPGRCVRKALNSNKEIRNWYVWLVRPFKCCIHQANSVCSCCFKACIARRVHDSGPRDTRGPSQACLQVPVAVHLHSCQSF